MSAIRENIKVIRIAAVQMQSKLGELKANLDHAELFAEQAAEDGAQLIAFPELAAPGYSMSPLIWDYAETRDGCTVQWVRDMSRKLGVYLGIGFVEAAEKDFFNTYVLGAPDGQVAGFVRKTMAETACFRCVAGSHVIVTEIGRIGLGICADNQFVPMVRLMQTESVDLMLMPYARPGPFKVGGAISQADIDGAYAQARDTAGFYTRLLGVPAVFINQVGPRGREKWFGIIGGLMNPDQVRLLGLSTIADLDGTVKAQMDDQQESVIAADVTLDPSRKLHKELVSYGSYGGGFLQPGTSGNTVRDIVCGVDAFFGRLSYGLSLERRRKARAVSFNGHV